MARKAYYYAVANGRSNGVYTDWNSCKTQVDGYSGAQFKKFESRAEAESFASGKRGGGGDGHQARDCSTTGNSDEHSRQNGGSVHDSGRSRGSEPVPGFVTKRPRLSASALASGRSVVVYTDGACTSNGRDAAAGGVGVYWGDGDAMNVSEPLAGPVQTNNRAELTAVIRAMEGYERAQKAGRFGEGEAPSLIINTDSKYVANIANEWRHGWKASGWKDSGGKPVMNRDLVERLSDLTDRIKPTIEHVRGHSGVAGNEKADRLAVLGIKK